MGASAAVVRNVSLAGITGTQTYTVSGFGTPKAAIFIANEATVNQVSHADASIGFGFTDGSRQFCVAAHSQDSQADSNTAHKTSTTQCIEIISSDATHIGYASFSQWVTDGVEINWTAAPDVTGWFVTCILVGGSDVSMYAGDFTASGSVTTETNVTDPGFTPDSVILIGAGNDAYDTQDSPTAQALFMLGFANWDGATVTQCSSNWQADDASATSVNRNLVSDLYANEHPAASYAIEIKDFDAQGFSAWTRIAGGAFKYAYLAMKFGGVAGHWAGIVTSPTTTGNKSVTTPGFKPQLVLQLPCTVTIKNSSRTSGSTGAGAFGLTAFDAASIFSTTVEDEDAAAFMVTDSWADTRLVCRDYLQQIIYVATFVSFDTNGWTLNYTTASLSGRVWPTLAIGEFVAANRIHEYNDYGRLNVEQPATVGY